MEYLVEVDENNTVRVFFNDATGEPIILQEKSPEGDDWSSFEEAKAWGLEKVEMMKANALAAEAELLALAAEAPIEPAPDEPVVTETPAE